MCLLRVTLIFITVVMFKTVYSVSRNERHLINCQQFYNLPGYGKSNSGKWSMYGGIYGSSYGYDTNSVNNIFTKSPLVTNNVRQDVHTGDIRVSHKGVFGYESTLVPFHKSNHYGGKSTYNSSSNNISNSNDDKNNDNDNNINNLKHCFTRARIGFKITKNVIQKSCLTLNVKSCEENCAHEKTFTCQVFAYRYNVDSANPTENCLLSGISLDLMNFYSDLEPDRNYDIYTITNELKACSITISNDSQHPPNECFWRVKSGFSFPKEVTKASLVVHNIGQCQATCIKSRDFTCRSLVFRYGKNLHGTSPNCFLSDHSSRDFNTKEMIEMDTAEMYERNSFGRGCELHPFLLYGSQKRIYANEDESCYNAYQKPCKLLPSSVRFSARVDTEHECRKRCSMIRRNNNVPCLSFSFERSNIHSNNCLMSDLSDKDLRPHYDYEYYDGHTLLSWQDLDPMCSTFNTPRNRNFYTLHTLYEAPTSLMRPSPSYEDGVSVFHFIQAENNKPYDDNRYHYNVGVNHKEVFGIHGNGDKEVNAENIFNRYSVSGYPCKKGTVCQRNPIGGYWFCETEGSEPGSWDYCCKSTHRCGFSDGYNYPWCFVGSSRDQWRPCSERYFPYGSKPHLDNSSYKRTYNKCESRHWPITYFYSQSPPNMAT